MTRRWPWVLWGLTMLLIVATFRLAALNDSFSEDPFFLSVAIVMIVGYTTLGALIASRAEHNAIGWLLMLIGAGFLLGGFTDEYLRYTIPRGIDGFFVHFSAWLTNWVFSLVAFPIPWILLLFPDGKLPTPRWRPVAIAIVALEVFLLLGAIVSPGPIDADFTGPLPQNPTGIAALEGVLDPLLAIGGFALLALGLSTVAALILRFRRSVGEERQQMRWFVAAVGLGTLLLIVAIVTGWGLQENETTALNDLVFFVFFTVLAIGLPGACAIAILRYRLYELDIVVKKTVLYAVVALVLIALFFVFAILVGAAFIEANPLAILGSIAIGLAIWPVVRVARRVADRVVYGGRATPYEVLTEFSDRVGGSYASEDVLPRMAKILADAVGARQAVVWLHVGNQLRPSGIAAPEEEPTNGRLAPRGRDPAAFGGLVRRGSRPGRAPRRPVGLDAGERPDQSVEGAAGARPRVTSGTGAAERATDRGAPGVTAAAGQRAGRRAEAPGAQHPRRRATAAGGAHREAALARATGGAGPGEGTRDGGADPGRRYRRARRSP